MSTFVHLHTHSHYSLLDGLSKIPDMVKLAKSYGMTAMALTDHGTMYGVIDFYRTCLKEGIKPIIGVEAYMAERSHLDKESGIDNKRYHLTLLAKNATGYHNLIKLSSIAHLEGFYYKPRMDEALLQQYNEGIICLSGCPGSRFIQALHGKDDAEARRLLQFYIDTFGKEHVFVEVMKHDEIAWYRELIPKIKAMAKEFDLPLVATWDSHYLSPEDKEAHNTLLAINTNNRNFKFDGDYSLISPEQAAEIFSDMPEAVEQTVKIADMVDIEFDPDGWEFPAFPIPADQTHDQVLRDRAYEGIDRRDYERTDELIQRIDYELDVIKQKGYATYFLCVGDFITYARANGILTNTRGSAAGSLVSYLVGITNVDPMKYRLFFERFLNPERPSLPDIDLDIADVRRDELLDYARDKYGKNAVAQIGTFGKMLARGVVRDVARALGHSYSVGDQIARLIPQGSQGFPMTIERAFEMSPELVELYETDRPTKEIIDLAKKIEGCARHISVHAAGMVISPTGDVTDFAPVQLDPKGGKIITQYNMYTGFKRENVVGMPKFDMLGLRNLSILGDALQRVKKIRGIEITIENMPDGDPKTYEMMSRGEAYGVFQFSSEGMRQWLKELKPTNLEDLIAMAALYRPGPMGFIPDYIKGKHHPETIKYIDDRLKPILERTYGIIVYQEQIIEIANQFASYTMGEADGFRKAVGKKIPELMAKEKKKFTEGCIAGGMTPKATQELWSMIETFAAYGFNKGHAASYGQLAYRTAYMKANYPQEYMSAIMTAESGNIEKVAEVIAETKRMGYEVLSPDINESFSNFTVVVDDDGNVTDKIRFGLRNVKNFGEEIGKAIIQERKQNGKFKNIEDFLERVKHRNLNKKSMEALIMCGAMDNLGERGYLLHNLEIMLNFNRELNAGNEHQASLFGDSELPKARLELMNCEPASQDEYLAWEKELLGMYVTGHPLEKHRDKLERAKNTVAQISNAEERMSNTVILGGIIETSKTILTKKKQEKMAFVTLTDLTGSIEMVVFPSTYMSYRQFLEPDTLIVVQGKISDRNGETSVIVERVKLLE